jgi:hypothetical protein
MESKQICLHISSVTWTTLRADLRYFEQNIHQVPGLQAIKKTAKQNFWH